MNDALAMLRAADPVPGTPSYPDSEWPQRIAQAQRAASGPAETAIADRPSRRRHVIITSVSCVTATLAVGLGTAAAAGWISPAARDAFRGASDPVSGEYANPASIEQELVGPGPEGTHVTVYGAPVGPQGFCTFTIVDREGADFAPGKPGGPGGSCSSQRLTGTGETGNAHWISPQTGVSYYVYSGLLGNAAGVEIRVDGEPVIPDTVGNGYFLVGPITEAQRAHATLVALDKAGHVLTVYGRQGQSLAEPSGPG